MSRRSTAADAAGSQEIELRLQAPASWIAAVRRIATWIAGGTIAAGGGGLVVGQIGNARGAEAVEAVHGVAAEVTAVKADVATVRASLPAPKDQATIEAAAAKTAARDAKIDGLVVAIDDLKTDLRELRKELRARGERP